MDTFLDLIPATQRASIQARVVRLSHETFRGLSYRQHHPGREMCRRVSTVVAAIAPQLPHERLSLLVRYSVWALLINDQLDAPTTKLARLDRLHSGVAAVTAGRAGAARDPLLAELARIVGRLSDYDRSGAVLARFGEALRDAVTADIDRALLGRAVSRGAAPPPSAERYLSVAARSINYSSFAYALIAMLQSGLTPGQLDRLDPALVHASYAIRLSNDVRTLGRDRAQAALNVLILRTAEGTPVTRRHVRHRIRRHLRAHHAALKPLTAFDSPSPGLGLLVPALVRSVEVSAGLYRSTDLR